MSETTGLEELINETITRFWETIPTVWHNVRGNVRGYAMDDFGLTVEQFYVLRHIRRGLHTTRELATARKISSSAISQSVDVLVEKGLVTRSAQKEDRRYVYLELTPKGNVALNDIFQKDRLWMSQKMQDLTDSDLQVLITAMNLLQETFREEMNE